MKKIVKVLGPYLGRADNRLFLILVHDDGSKRYVNEARYVLERHLGRRLTNNECVLFRDGDKTNVKLSNLVLTSREEAGVMVAERVHRVSKRLPKEGLSCDNCGSEVLTTRDRKTRYHKGCRQFFCSMKCRFETRLLENNLVSRPCLGCNTQVPLTSMRRHRIRLGKPSPFCSRKCAVVYHRSVKGVM